MDTKEKNVKILNKQIVCALSLKTTALVSKVLDR